MMNTKKNTNKAIAQAQAKADWIKSMTEDFYADEKKNPSKIGAIGVGNTIIVAYADSVDEPLIGVAKCNPTDQYDREVGIAIAYARAIGEDIPDYVLDSDVSPDEDEDWDEDEDEDWDEDDDWDEDEDDDWDEDESYIEFGEICIGGKFLDDGELFIKVSDNKAYRYKGKKTFDFDENYVVDSIVTG